jgi:hypothetical protein
MSSAPPPEVARAAAVVSEWLRERDGAANPTAPLPAGRLSDAEYKALSPAAKLDYSRSFDQSQFKNDRS